MLKGKSVTIRTIAHRDIQELAQHLSDVKSSGDFLPTQLLSESEIENRLKENGYISETFSRYLITDTSDQIIGSIWCFPSIPYFSAIEVGYHIFDETNRGNGYIPEALALFTSFLFNANPIHRVELRIATENKASERVALKLGFTHEGTHRHAAFCGGKMHDMKTYAMLREEWQRLTH